MAVPPSRLIAATACDLTLPCVEAAREVLAAAGYEVRVFEVGDGRTMERLVREGRFVGVLDITTAELADQLVGGVLAAGVDRLTAAAIVGVPQVIGLGALDAVNFGPPEGVPAKYAGRRFYQPHPTLTLMRTTAAEGDRLGKEIAEKASASRGPTRVFVPLRGLSSLDTPGQPFHAPEANAALFQSLRNWIYPPELLREVDAHINDRAFAVAMAGELLAMLTPSGRG